MANSFIFQDQIIHVSDRVAVYLKIVEEGKTRTQAFEGLVLSVNNREVGKSFTIRKIATGNIGVERILPIASPTIDKIVVKTRGSVRRGKLHYLRGRTGRLALRVKEFKSSISKAVASRKSPSAKSPK